MEPTKPFFDRTTPELIGKRKQLLPEFTGLEKLLDKDPKEIFFKINPSLKNMPITPKMEVAMTRMIETARASLVKTSLPGFSGDFTTDEKNIMCEIILPFARPALLIQNDDYIPPPEESQWYEILKQHRAMIDETFKSVGRIEYMRGTKEWNMATGFLVADDVMMTTRHVAEYFCEQKGTEWTFQTGITSHIDYCEEKDTVTPREFKIKKILKVYDEPTDLALFKVTKSSKVSWASKRLKHPKPLVFASNMPAVVKDRNVYVVGYPVYDVQRNTDDDLFLVFGNDWGVKRLQPGTTTGVQAGVLYHDCSAIGGNSGSCVIDIELNQVVGLHFKGIFGESEYNQAVALPPLKNELKQYGVKFT